MRRLLWFLLAIVVVVMFVLILQQDESALGNLTRFDISSLGVKVVALEGKGGASNGSYADVISGKYPLARFLYVYVNRAPGKPLDPVVREFLKLVFSREGREIVLKDGYYPLPASVVKEELAKIQ